MDYTAHGIPQARILEWVAFPFSRGSSQPWDRTQVSRGAHLFSHPTHWAWNPNSDTYWLWDVKRFMQDLGTSSYLLMKMDNSAMANAGWHLLGVGRGQGCWPFILSLSWPQSPMRKAAASPPPSQLHVFGNGRLRALHREIPESSLMTTKKSGVAFPRFRGWGWAESAWEGPRVALTLTTP